MSIEGAGKPNNIMGAARRVAPVAVGAGLAAAACSGEGASLATAFLVLLSAGLFPDQSKELARAAWRGIGASFRSVLARPLARIKAKHEPLLPTTDVAYRDGFTDHEWAAFVYEDLFKKGAKGDGFAAHTILKRHGISWDTFIRHRRPFRRGGDSLTTHDVQAVVKEFGLSDEAAYRASVAWAVRAAGGRLDVHDSKRASVFFKRLAAIVGAPSSSTDVPPGGGYSEPFTRLINNLSRYMESGLPHAEGALAVYLANYYASQRIAPAGSRLFPYPIEQNERAMVEASHHYFNWGWTTRRHQSAAERWSVEDVNRRISQREISIIVGLHHVGECMSAVSYATSIQTLPASSRKALSRALGSFEFAAQVLFRRKVLEDPEVASFGFPAIARYAAENVYGRAYRQLQELHPGQPTHTTPQRMLRSCPPKSAPARIFRGLMKV